MAKPEYVPTEGAVAFAAFLKKHCLTYARAGELLHVSDVAVYHWSVGAKTPNPTNRRKIEVFTRETDAGAGIDPSLWNDGSEQQQIDGVAPFVSAPTGTDG